MKTRNEKLHQEVLKVVEIKLHVPRLKDIAEKHHVQVQTVRKLVSSYMKRAKINKDTVSRETNYA